MKKAILVGIMIASLPSVGLAAPMVDYEKEKVAIDLSFQPNVGFGEDMDGLDGKTKNLDFAVTAALSDKWGIQYVRNNLKTDTFSYAEYGPGYSGSMRMDSDVKVDQFNITYNSGENTVLFAGYTRHKFNMSGNVSVNVAGYGSLDENYSVSSKSEGGFQIGAMQIVPINDTLKSYGILGVGNKLFNVELGLSQELSQNIDLNVFYKYMRCTDIGGTDLDIDAKGLGLGVSCKF